MSKLCIEIELYDDILRFNEYDVCDMIFNRIKITLYMIIVK